MGGKGAEMLREDLDAAGIDWREDDRGAVLDFHAPRHTYGTMLAAAGVHPKAAMDLMRHSDINLTMRLYTHTLIGDRAKATAAPPDVAAPVREAKTGTADAPEPDAACLAALLAVSCAAGRAHPQQDATSGGGGDETAKFNEKAGEACLAASPAGGGVERVKGIEPSTFSLGS